MSEIQAAEARKVDLQKQVNIRDQILRLSENSDFRAIIENGFMEKEAARNARIAGDPMLDKQQREDAIAMAVSAGHLSRYLSANIQMGNMAAREIEQLDVVLEELRNEEAE